MPPVFSFLKRIRAMIKSFNEKLSNRADSEHEQAYIRFFFGLGIFGYLLISSYLHEQSLRLVFFLIGLFLVFSVAILFWIYYSPASNHYRRILGMAIDNSAITCCMIMTDNLGVPLFGVFLWVTFGYGFRYGKSYLYIAHLMSIGGFAAVVLFTPFWSTHSALGASLFGTILVLPFYVATLLQRITDALNRAEEANKAKSIFVANMSHEMRTPLNGIIGINELMKTTRLNSEQQELVETLDNSARVLLSLIENVLDISKIEARKVVLEITNFDLHALLSSTIRMLSPQAEAKGLKIGFHITADASFMLRGSVVHLRQVLINLIGNAIKFTQHGGVDIRVSAIKSLPNLASLHFSIIDTGIGIPAEALGYIFNSFVQADQSTTRKYGGTGLGTTIAKHLVELMGGQIGVESQPGVGSNFWFELAFEKQNEGSPRKIAGLHLSEINILLLSSGDVERTSVETCLMSWGAAFTSIARETEVLPLLSAGLPPHTSYQVLLINAVDVEDVNSFAIRLRTEITDKNVSVILLNSFLTGKTNDELFRAGYDCVLYGLEKTHLFNALHAATVGEQIFDESIIPFSPKLALQSAATLKLSILVAEDNPTNQLVIAKILERAGHSVQLVNNGDEALDALEENFYDIAIVDMHMPIMGGIEAAKIYKLANLNNSRRVPFVMLTANATTEALQECTEVGIEAFLSKPVEPKRLLQTINKLTKNDELKDINEMPQNQAAIMPLRQTESTQASAQSYSPAIDRTTLQNLSLLGKGDHFLLDVIDCFFKDSETLLHEMKIAASRKHFEVFKDLTHALKGSAGNIGATMLCELCNPIAKLNHMELAASIDSRLENIANTMELTRSAIMEFLEQRRKTAH